jgi:hypothetical protein
LKVNLLEICLEGDFDDVCSEVSEYGIKNINGYWDMEGRICATPDHFRPDDEPIYNTDYLVTDKINIVIVYANSSTEVNAFDTFLNGLEDVIKKIYKVDKVNYLLRPVVNYSMPSFNAWLYSRDARFMNPYEFNRGCLMAECARMNNDLDKVTTIKDWSKQMVSQAELNHRLCSALGLQSFFIIDPTMVFGRALAAHADPLPVEDKFNATYSFLLNFLKFL